ncbi:MAG: GLPGLI family protein, partial [Sphingobacteriales bacterium]
LIKKKINSRNESYMTQSFENYKKNFPQFKSAKSTLKFNSEKSLYKFNEDALPTTNNWLHNNPIADLKNIVGMDYNTETNTIQKTVYEATYLVKDSIRKINWKITDETREIAGYECRRANAIIMDSVYVVAYYSNQIAVSGGPETFSGLPGMILGLALPHDNITWFATKVTEIAVPEKDLLPPAKGKPTDNAALKKILTTVFKDEGDYIFLLGKSSADIASSEYVHKVHGIEFSPAPQFDIDEELSLQRLLSKLIENKLVRSAHDVSEGGLAITLLESCFNRNLGVDVVATDSGIRKDAYWFGEKQSRVVVSVSAAQVDAFKAAVGSHPFEELGVVTSGDIEVDGLNWGSIDEWKLAYDTAIENVIEGQESLLAM